MASYIRRREFLATLGGAAATWPLAARAQEVAPSAVTLQQFEQSWRSASRLIFPSTRRR
jgi:hypothetical protein